MQCCEYGILIRIFWSDRILNLTHQDLYNVVDDYLLNMKRKLRVNVVTSNANLLYGRIRFFFKGWVGSGRPQPRSLTLQKRILKILLQSCHFAHLNFLTEETFA